MPTGQRKVDPKLLEILVCPLTKQPLRYDPDRQELISEQAGLAYPIRDGIPIMLVDEARPLEEHEGSRDRNARQPSSSRRDPVQAGGEAARDRLQ